MILNFQKKEQIVCRINEIAKTALSAVVASLDGVTVNEVTKLRKEARDSGVCIYVIRNTLMRRVVKNTSFECLKDVFLGQSVIAFSINKPSDSARIFVKFTKDHEYFKIKGAAFEGKFISASQISLLSDLPDYKEAISRLILVIKINSIGNLIRILYVLAHSKG